MVDMDIDGIALDVLAKSVQAVLELVGTQDAFARMQQRLQQRQLATRQLHRFAVQGDFVAGGGELQGAMLDKVNAAAGRAPMKRVQTRHQFGQVERLEQIVIRACL